MQLIFSYRGTAKGLLSEVQALRAALAPQPPYQPCDPALTPLERSEKLLHTAQHLRGLLIVRAESLQRLFPELDRLGLAVSLTPTIADLLEDAVACVEQAIAYEQACLAAREVGT